MGGGLQNPKNPYQKKLRWSKKGEGVGLSFFTKSKKKQLFFTPPLSPLIYLKVIIGNLDNDKKKKSKSYNIFRFPLGDQSALSHSGEPLINQDHHKITIKHHTVPIKELKWCTLNTNSVSQTYIFKNRRLGTTIKPLCQETRGA